jgi:hypothetical protein
MFGKRKISDLAGSFDEQPTNLKCQIFMSFEVMLDFNQVHHESLITFVK